jgi:hypothetical protein
VRIVVYVEGPAEEGAARQFLPAPGDPIPEELLGPAHLLVRRCIAEGTEVPAEAISFEVPLLLRGRIARGSDLRVCKNLHKLLAWPRPEDVPDLAIVLIDADDDLQIRAHLTRCMEQRPLLRPTAPVGVAFQEFESWLLGDQNAVHAVVDHAYDGLPDREGMACGEAKRILQGWLATAHPDDPDARNEARKEIVIRASLDEMARRCRTFDEFRRNLIAAATG